jgi:hypothetical protein
MSWVDVGEGTFSSFLTSTRVSTLRLVTESRSTFEPTKFTVVLPFAAAICTVFSNLTGSRDRFIGFAAIRSAIMVLRRVMSGERVSGEAPAEARSSWTYSVGEFSSSSVSSM